MPSTAVQQHSSCHYCSFHDSRPRDGSLTHFMPNAWPTAFCHCSAETLYRPCSCAVMGTDIHYLALGFVSQLTVPG